MTLRFAALLLLGGCGWWQGTVEGQVEVEGQGELEAPPAVAAATLERERAPMPLADTVAAAPESSAALTDLPPLSEPRIVTTSFPDGLWHHKNGVPRDNTGDGQVGVVIDGDGKRWVLWMRMGWPSPPGGAFWTKPYTPDNNTPFKGWGGNVQEPVVKGLPGLPPHSHGNIDTWHWFQYPYRPDVELFAGVKPGARREWAQITESPANPAGLVFSIQRSTANTFGAEASNYTRYPGKLWLKPHVDAAWEHPVYYPGTNSFWGGVAEGAVVVDTFNFPIAVGVGFYTAKRREPPDAFGQRHRSRIGRYAFYLDGPNAMQPVRLPSPGPDSYVWDPVRDGAGGVYGKTNETAVFGTANRILQMSVSINPYDGVYHLVMWQSTPSTNQGKVNKSVGLAHYWSANQGRNWVPDTGNPLFTRQSMGWELVTANQMNSPNIYWNPWTKKGYLFFWGNETGRQNHVGTRLYCMDFDLGG